MQAEHERVEPVLSLRCGRRHGCAGLLRGGRSISLRTLTRTDTSDVGAPWPYPLSGLCHRYLPGERAEA